MARYREIEFKFTDRVARITLSRPPLNVISISTLKEIADAIQRIGKAQDTCAIVFAAQPNARIFSAGVSIEDHQPETVFQMLEEFHGIFRSLEIVSKPVVALVGGAALGGACEIVAFADIVIASQSARFGQPEIKIGVFPPLAAVLLPRVIGEKKAREMILTGELLTAEGALSLGLINHLVADGELEAKGEEVLGVLRQMSVPALESARRVMSQASGVPFAEALKRSEDIYLNELMSHKDPLEGIEAFIGKRAPQWKHK